jgi:CRISPR-associated protein Cas6
MTMDVDELVAAATLVDLAFPVQGRALPREHRALLAQALAERLPWLGVVPGTGIHRLNLVSGGGAGGEQELLSARTRLTLRVPREQADAATGALAGQTLDVGGQPLRLGAPQLRELLPHRTLYAHFVAAPSDDEMAFLAMVDDELRTLGVACRPVVGRRQEVTGDAGPLPGFSLMLDGLSPEDALRVLLQGLGAHRRMGCGLFIPHKSAAAVGG